MPEVTLSGFVCPPLKQFGTDDGTFVFMAEKRDVEILYLLNLKLFGYYYFSFYRARSENKTQISQKLNK